MLGVIRRSEKCEVWNGVQLVAVQTSSLRSLKQTGLFSVISVIQSLSAYEKAFGVGDVHEFVNAVIANCHAHARVVGVVFACAVDDHAVDCEHSACWHGYGECPGPEYRLPSLHRE